MRILLIVITGVFVFCSIAGVSPAKEKKRKYIKSKHGVKALIKLSKSRDEMVRDYDKETMNYQKIKKAIDLGRVKKKEAASQIRSKYGEPVIVLSEKEGEVFRWVYKPSTATFFDKEKVYLFFNKDEELTGWKALESREENLQLKGREKI